MKENTPKLNNSVFTTDGKIQLFYLNGEKIFSKKDFLLGISTLMLFPDYFKDDLYSLEKCLCDLEWIENTRIIFIYFNADVFSTWSPQEYKEVIFVLERVIEYWSIGKTPFDVLFIVNP
jgi:RNAse (barnase) inhibitor barstar